MVNLYGYKAKVLSSYDADNLEILIDCGFNIYLKEKARLNGIDAPELRTKNKKEKELAYEARNYVRDLVLDKDIEITTTKEGKYGRYLIDVYLEDGTHLNKHLIDIGYAKEYHGGKKEKWFDE